MKYICKELGLKQDTDEFTFADWKKALAMDQFYHLQLNEYPGWDKEVDKDHPPYFHFYVKRGQDKDSRTLAIAFDDIASGCFYYRDWTTSGLPFVDDKEVYQSGFWFEKMSDKERFIELYNRSRAI